MKKLILGCIIIINATGCVPLILYSAMQTNAEHERNRHQERMKELELQYPTSDAGSEG